MSFLWVPHRSMGEELLTVAQVTQRQLKAQPSMSDGSQNWTVQPTGRSLGWRESSWWLCWPEPLPGSLACPWESFNRPYCLYKLRDGEPCSIWPCLGTSWDYWDVYFLLLRAPLQNRVFFIMPCSPSAAMPGSPRPCSWQSKDKFPPVITLWVSSAYPD